MGAFLWRRRVALTAVFIGALVVEPSLSLTAPPRFSEPMAQIAAAQVDAGSRSALKLTVVGSGGGPSVDVRHFGPSILIDAGGELLLFDCGRGAAIRLAQLGIRSQRINRVFLTHLHSDHVIDLPDLFLTPWPGLTGRRVPFEVWGPSGTREMMDYMQRAFAFDIRVRGDVGLPKEGIRVLSHDIEQGTVLESRGVKVTAFLVDHGPVSPAFGYRIDYGGHSVALSGDTRFSENLIKFAQGVDVLVHEAGLDDVPAGNLTRDQREQFDAIVALHTLPEQVGEVFSRVKPRLAVYAHAPASESLIARTRRTYSGPLEGPEDMLTVEIGQAIDVRHAPNK